MSKRKYGLALSLVLAAGTLLGACGTDKEKKNNAGSTEGGNEDNFSIAMVRTQAVLTTNHSTNLLGKGSKNSVKKTA